MSWSMKSNNATRTKETLQIMPEQAPEFSEAKVYFVPSFYSVAAMDGQTADHLQNTICEYSRDEILTVMCMGHNRGWEEAASVLSGAPIELKTCNAALLEATGKSWNEVCFPICSCKDSLHFLDMQGHRHYNWKALSRNAKAHL